jgi:type IV secretion system protein VirD4
VSEREPDPVQLLVLGALGLLASASLLVVGVGQVAGRLLGDGAPTVGLGEAAGVLRHLPASASDPAAAWPHEDAALLPGPVGMYGSLLLLLAVAMALGLIGWRVRAVLTGGPADSAVAVPGQRPPRAPKRLSGGSTAFASATDIAPLTVAAAEPGRIVLGWSYKRLIATEPEHSVLVVGATRSGKTRGFAIPAVREWEGPALVLSAKTDLLHATYDDRVTRGRVFVYDPTGVSGHACDGWSPLAAAGTWAGAVRAANSMSRLSGTTAGLGGAGNHWERVAAQLLAPLLLAAATGGLDMSDVVRWTMTKKLDEPQALIDLLGREGEVAHLSLKSYLDLEPRARDSAFSTVRTVLDVFEDPGVAEATTRWDIRPEHLLDGSSATVYLVAGSVDQARLAPVFLALIDELLRNALTRAAERRAATGDPLIDGDDQSRPRLLVLLDEAANIAPLPDLATLASTAGGEGVQLVTIFQDLSQIRHRYGTQWGSIVSNHVAKVVLPGVTDPETLTYFSHTVGEEEVLSVTTSRGADGRRTRSEVAARRPVIGQRDLRELPSGEGMCLYGPHPPIRFRLRQA